MLETMERHRFQKGTGVVLYKSNGGGQEWSQNSICSGSGPVRVIRKKRCLLCATAMLGPVAHPGDSRRGRVSYLAVGRQTRSSKNYKNFTYKF